MRRRRRDPDVLPAFVRPLALIMVCGLIIILMAYILVTPPKQRDKQEEDVVKEEKYEVTYDVAVLQKGLYFTEEVIKEKGIEEILKVVEQNGMNAAVIEADYKTDLQKEVSELLVLLSEKNMDSIIRLSYIDSFGMSGDKERALEYCIKAAELGADEINIDYVGTDGAGKTEFIRYIYEGVAEKDIRLSADLYVPLIGTDEEKATKAAELSGMLVYLDYLCPVLYPSYYEFKAELSIYDKELKIIEAFEELLVLAGHEKNAKVRPWIQAFDGTTMSDYSAAVTEVAPETVRAAEDCGIGSYVLYNPKGEYEY